MVTVENKTPICCLVKSGECRHEGLVVHGYGSNKEEVLGLAVDLAERLELSLALFDLPGHGRAGAAELTLTGALAAVEQAAALLSAPSFFVGHSLGANLGLMFDFKVAVLISMPAPGRLEAGRDELVRSLRARRVNEASSYSGLKEILAVLDVRPPPKTLALRADKELKSVLELADRWRESAVDFHTVADSNHLDIVSAPLTSDIIAGWLSDNLE